MIKRILTIGFSVIPFLLSAQNYDAELVSQETNITINNGKLIKTSYCELKINNRAGEKYTKVTIPYSNIYKVSKIEAYLKDYKGAIVRKLKKSEISERSSISNFSFYEDNYVKEFTLKHNIYPYTLVYSYKIQQNEFLYLDYWIPVLDRRIPTHKATLNVALPLNYNISYSNNLINEFKVDSTEALVRYTWKTSYSNIVKSEVFSPPLDNYLPSVVIVPQNFKYELNGSFKSWSDYGSWQSELMQGINELPDNEKKQILTLIKDVDDNKEKTKILYHYLQDETRYINITIETGGLKPYPASYVAENKYGDCKALTNYFKSVLDFIGIRSYYSKVFAGNPIKEIDKSFPSQQFNHIILYIPLQNDTIWLDCTSDGAFNYLGTFTQNRNALVIDKNNSSFMRTPSLSHSDVLESRKIIIPYNQKQDLNARFRNVYKGEMYESLLELESTFSESEKSRILRNHVVENGFELFDYNIYKSHRDSHQIQLSYEASSRNIYNQYGNEILVRNIPFSIPQFEEPEDRKLPVQIDYPLYKIDTLIYEIPQGFRLHKNLVNQSVSNSFGHYMLEFFQQKKTIQVVKSLLINPGFYPISVYKNLYSFFKEIDKIENNIYITLIK